MQSGPIFHLAEYLMPGACEMQATIAEMKSAACEAFELDESQVQCWDYHQCAIQGNKALDAEGESPSEATLRSCNILDGQDILVIEKVAVHFQTV